MVGEIRILTDNIIHKIAAGEVIERPASVIKELVENSIDAKSTRISIELQAGGTQLITVSDDGIGMTRKDVEICAHRHATSKISNPSELFNINTLGFRGEALASIGAISHMTIETRVKVEPEGTQLVVEGGIRRRFQPLGRAPGTTVIVRNLFFNTPARRKFLRQIDTEVRYINQTVVQLSAAYPELGFELMHQGRIMLNYLPAVERTERAGELLGIDSTKLIEVQSCEAGIEIDGFISPPALCRKTREKQFLIIRGRPIVSHALAQAISRGYGGLLAADLNTSFILWLDLEPNKIDVNVHPTKREIRLADEIIVEQVLEMAIRQALKMPKIKIAEYKYNTALDLPQTKEPGTMFSALETTAEKQETIGELISNPQLPLALLTSSKPRLDAGWHSSDLRAIGFERVWQIHDKYIMAITNDGILFIDQQAAHERVLFEETLQTIDRSSGCSQHLLLPTTLSFNAAEWEAVNQAIELFTELGFSLREFGPHTLLIEAIPAIIDKWDDGRLFMEILQSFMEDQKKPGRNMITSLSISYASKNAIRAGQRLSQEQTTSLLEGLVCAEEPFVCPHGKNVFVKINLNEIDRLFGR